MSEKAFSRFCYVVIACMLVLTMAVMNLEAFGIQQADRVLGYEETLFDQSQVHTINIIMDDWDDFIENCEDEEYRVCSVVIDNEAESNVGIRAKGNTSLSQVRNYDNDRYSFKIEFDHYDSTNTYHGLDKLNLNNIIQDNTYMKDYLCYTLMNEFDVAAPLCSYAMVQVNGEDWGLYLAVEAVEDSFRLRNYGSESGNLYKPDSQTMGGGRANGADFDFDDWQDKQTSSDDNSSADANTDTQTDNQNRPDMPGGMQTGGGDFGGGDFSMDLDSIKEQLSSLDDDTLTSLASALGYDSSQALLEAANSADSLDTLLNGHDIKDVMDTLIQNTDFGQKDDKGQGGGGKGGGNMTIGSSDVSLIYSDDDFDSYSNIFDSAKNDIDDSDKERLITSLKDLNSQENIEEVVDVDAVIRYFVVHNFVDNFDSYTGSMIHNYYLYENDGQLSMIPWDYNLAFGGFVGGSDATTMVNYPIDTPVSGGTIDSRPMLAWIFDHEEYTQKYHEYFQEFIDEIFNSGRFEELFDSTVSLISDDVDSDPTKFCTTEEFQTGSSTLRQFCLLRAQSISGQLAGTIPSTSDGQSQDSSSLIDASSLSIDDMGTMNIGGGQMGGGMDIPGNMEMPDFSQDAGTAGETDESSEAVSEQSSSSTFSMQRPDSTDSQVQPNTSQDQMTPQNMGDISQMMQPGMNEGDTDMPEMPSDGQMPSDMGGMPQMGGGFQPDQQMDNPSVQSDSQDSMDTQSSDAAADSSADQSTGTDDSNQSDPGAMDPSQNGNQPGGGGQPGDDFGGSSQEDTSVSSETGWVLLASSAVVLILGIVIAFVYKKRV